MTNKMDDADKRQGDQIAERLPSWVVPVTRDPADVQRALDYDMAICVNTRLDENVDPDALQDADVYSEYLDTVLDEGEHMDSPFQMGIRPNWIVDDTGEYAGSMGYVVWRRDLEFTSVYIRPRFRRQGRASRLFQIIKNLALEVGIDRIIVRCHWGNDNALRFYLAQGMWVIDWKHTIRFAVRREQSPLQMKVEGTRAKFLVRDRLVAVADNHGDRLGWQLADDIDKEFRDELEGTAALYLAINGWPIIRSDELWQEQVFFGFSDCGTFEGLAHRIRHFERLLRKHGWKMPPPNPSFATLPTLVGVERGQEQLEVTVSDGRSYPYPYELLDPQSVVDDPVMDVSIQVDEVVCTRRSGQMDVVSIDEVFSMNETPEKLGEELTFWRDFRSRNAAALLLRPRRGIGNVDTEAEEEPNG